VVKARKAGRTVYSMISHPEFYQGASFIGIKEKLLKGGNFIANIQEGNKHKEEALI